jgi:hypothetical protein
MTFFSVLHDLRCIIFLKVFPITVQRYISRYPTITVHLHVKTYEGCATEVTERIPLKQGEQCKYLSTIAKSLFPTKYFSTSTYPQVPTVCFLQSTYPQVPRVCFLPACVYSATPLVLNDLLSSQRGSEEGAVFLIFLYVCFLLLFICLCLCLFILSTAWGGVIAS